MSHEITSPEFRNVRRLGKNAPHARRNHSLGVTAGTFAGMAVVFFQPELIIGGLIYALTGSTWVLALVPIINKAGGLTPQLLAGTRMEHLARRRPLFVLLTFIRVTGFAALTFTVYLLYLHPGAWTLSLFLGLYLLICVSGGTTYVVFMDMVGRLIPTHRVGSFLGMRQMLGGGMGVLLALLVLHPILSSPHLELPLNYLVVFGIGTLLVALDMGTFTFCREEPSEAPANRTTLGQSLRRGIQWIQHDHNYRCYLYSRVAFRIAYLGLAFFIPYGTIRLGYGKDPRALAELAGIMIAMARLISIASSAAWGRLADHYGSRVTMIAGGGFLTLAPLIALSSPQMPEAFSLPLPFSKVSLTLPLLTWLLSLAAFWTGIRANILGGHRFLVIHAPPSQRAAYVAFNNTITSPLTLLPLAGAWLAETGGMDALFVGVACGGLLSIFAAWRMHPDTTALKAAATSA
jgi:MFS family permease